MTRYLRGLNWMLVLAVAAAALSLAACGREPGGGHDDHEGHDHGDHDGHDDEGHDDHGDEEEGAAGEHEQDVHVSVAQMEEYGVKVAAAGARELTLTVKLPGEVVLNPDRVVHVGPRTTGFVRQVDVRTGDKVAAGDMLAVLESAELADAKAAYLSLLQAVELEKIDLDRIQTIHDNTLTMLELMRGEPKLEELAQLAGLDLGTNRRDLLITYAKYITARSAFERQQQLRQDDITSLADFQIAQSAFQEALASYVATRDDMVFQNRRALDARRRAFKTAQARMDAATRRLFTLGLAQADVDRLPSESDERLSRLEIRAPIEGVVIDRHATRGEMLKDDTQAFLIADLSNVWVHVTVYQKNLGQIVAGQNATIHFGHGMPVARGKIEYVSPVVDESTRTATGRIVLNNPDGRFYPGLFVTAHIELGPASGAVVVPRDAVHTLEGRQVVFVRTAHGFAARPVVSGQSDAQHVEIVSGLTAGEQYAAANALTLKAELTKGSFGGHGHAH